MSVAYASHILKKNYNVVLCGPARRRAVRQRAPQVGEIEQSVPSARVNARSWPVVIRVRFPPRTATASFSTSDTPRVKSLPSQPPSPWLCPPGANRAGIGRAGGRGGSPGREGAFNAARRESPGSGSDDRGAVGCLCKASMWPGASRERPAVARNESRWWTMLQCGPARFAGISDGG